MSNLPERIIDFNERTFPLVDEGIQLLHNGTPQIFVLNSKQSKSKGTIVINPGLATRHLHLKEPFLGFQLAQIGYTVLVINTLDLPLYGLDPTDPSHRSRLTEQAYSLIEVLADRSKIISLGHSLGCIDLLLAKPQISKASIFLSPGFKGDKKKFSLLTFLKFLNSWLNNESVDLKVHGNSFRPELAPFKNDLVNARFLFNLKNYSNSLSKEALSLNTKPAFVWLGSKTSTDGIIQTKHVHEWVKDLQKTSQVTLSVYEEAGHEPGWKNPLHAPKLAKEIDSWIEEYVL